MTVCKYSRVSLIVPGFVSLPCDGFKGTGSPRFLLRLYLCTSYRQDKFWAEDFVDNPRSWSSLSTLFETRSLLLAVEYNRMVGLRSVDSPVSASHLSVRALGLGNRPLHPASGGSGNPTQVLILWWPVLYLLSYLCSPLWIMSLVEKPMGAVSQYSFIQVLDFELEKS